MRRVFLYLSADPDTELHSSDIEELIAANNLGDGAFNDVSADVLEEEAVRLAGVIMNTTDEVGASLAFRTLFVQSSGKYKTSKQFAKYLRRYFLRVMVEIKNECKYFVRCKSKQPSTLDSHLEAITDYINIHSNEAVIIDDELTLLRNVIFFRLPLYIIGGFEIHY